MHGKGYRVSMICDSANVPQVRKIIEKIVPHSIFMDASGQSGGMIFNVPQNHVQELGPIFSIMNKMHVKATTVASQKRKGTLNGKSALENGKE